MWDPRQYLRFGDERARPFVELVSRIPASTTARHVVDLGCGPGSSTALLAERWPDASVTGVDSSPEMVAEARRTVPAVEFVEADIATWTPGGQVDVVVSNAALHWVPGHEALVERMVWWLAPGGWLAFQVPGNFEAPSHTTVRDVCTSPRWASALGTEAGMPASAREPSEYLELLVRLGCRVDAWETTYLHVLAGDDPVLHWIMGTALRPALSRLADAADRAAFLAEVAGRLREAYPPGPAGTVFAFRRIFVVAQRRDDGSPEVPRGDDSPEVPRGDGSPEVPRGDGSPEVP
jgi:trans-aconitate 2-methyltransferase